METSDRLVTSAQRLLWERGYGGTSPRAIQELAGVGQSSMYHHFRDKSDLAAAAIRRSADDLRAAAEAELGAEGPALKRLTAYLSRERDVLKGCRIGRLAQDSDVVSTPVLRQPLADMFTWLRSRIGSVLEEGRTSGELRPDLDCDGTAAAICAALQGAYVMARAADSTEPFEAAIRGALGLLRTTAEPEPDRPRGR